MPSSVAQRRARALLVALIGLPCACSTAAIAPSAARDPQTRPDAPIVAEQAGAWFNADGGLAVVGAGRRLRLVLSAPIIACGPAFQTEGAPGDVVTRASLPFRVLGEACRSAHPSILLPEESDTASPSELERSYHEVARCTALDLGATQGWIPKLVEASDPCPSALGLGWRLPQAAELHGLTLDDRKAVAGALFDTEDRAGFGSLLLYARDAGGTLTLVTLSPNAAEQAPRLSEAERDRPFFGAALRCVRDANRAASAPRSLAPPLPHAAECLRALRAERTAMNAGSSTPPVPEVQKLKLWIEQAQRAPGSIKSEASLRELTQLLATPAIEQLAQEARDEQALTEHYAELAEGLDDASVSAGERERRRAEFDSLRRRLGGQIVHGAGGPGSGRTQLAALLAHLTRLLEGHAAHANTAKKSAKARMTDYEPLLSRLRQLRGEKATLR